MQLQNKLAGLYLSELMKAQGNALNEEQNAQLPDAELIRARDS
jgi:hypothetical protein